MLTNIDMFPRIKVTDEVFKLLMLGKFKTRRRYLLEAQPVIPSYSDIEPQQSVFYFRISKECFQLKEESYHSWSLPGTLKIDRIDLYASGRGLERFLFGSVQIDQYGQHLHLYLTNPFVTFEAA